MAALTSPNKLQQTFSNSMKQQSNKKFSLYNGWQCKTKSSMDSHEGISIWTFSSCTEVK